ncbi:hypothetical protein FQN57_002432 [Myotisia sp. PD_48]|nr:hypothetical protein FQN57_002432 [Myotisia sp. PD_48]
MASQGQLDVMMSYWFSAREFLLRAKNEVPTTNVMMFLGLILIVVVRNYTAKPPKKRARKFDVADEDHFPPIEPLDKFDWKTTEPLQLRPYKPKYHLTMALENLDPNELIPMDKTYKERIAYRRTLLKEHHDVVLGINSPKNTNHKSNNDNDNGSPEDPRIREAVTELYEYVMGIYLPARYPTMFTLLETKLSDEQLLMVQNRVTGEILPTSLSPNRPLIKALETLVKTVDEDMLILLPEIDTNQKSTQKQDAEPEDPRLVRRRKGGDGAVTAGEKRVEKKQHKSEEKKREIYSLLENGDGSTKYILEAYAACYPSGFDTRKKLGKPLAKIHDPVPGYKEKLEKSMDRYFERLEVGKYVKRANWTVTTGADLFAAFGGIHSTGKESMKELTVEALDLDNTYFRSERQTLYRLPISGAVVFSFHTYIYPIKQIKEEGSGEDLAAAIDGVEAGSVPEMDRYKRIPVWGNAIKEYLTT